MDERTKELVAIGAAAAADCYPCLQHHLAECDRLDIDRTEAKAAIEIGVTVNRSAAVKTKEHARNLLGMDMGQKKSEHGCCGS